MVLCNNTKDGRKLKRSCINCNVDDCQNCEDPFLRAVGFCSLPACVWYGNRCPEIKGCGLAPKLSTEIINSFGLSKE